MSIQSSRRDAGSSLLLVCFLVFCVAALGVGLADQALKSGRREDTGQLLRQVHEAIVGDPGKNVFGYLGDVGDYPASLVDLVQNPGGSTPGWKGPYLSNISIDNGMILDSYFSPLEYFLDATPGVQHKLAIISRGPDHDSSNPATNPNVYSQFSGILPSDGSYGTTAGNTDNVGSRDFVADPNVLNYTNFGTLQLNIQNIENWNSGGVQNVCPRLYSLQISSLTRGTVDSLSIPADNMALHLLQGMWDVRVISVARQKEAWAEQATIQPAAKVTQQTLLFPTDSSEMPAKTLTVTNNLSQALTITRNDSAFATDFTVDANGGTAMGSNFGCVRVAAKTGGVNGTVQYQWVLPYGAADQSVVVSPNSYSLSVANQAGGYRQLVVWVHGPTLAAANALGNVADREVRTFTIMGGNTVWITDGFGNQLDTFAVNAPLTKSY